jgi:putative PIN family toxin of toxin-antitoxin system
MNSLPVVIDTNIFISAILFEGEVNKLVYLWQCNKIKILMSHEILQEYIMVLSYPKFKLKKSEIEYIIKENLLPFIEVIQIKTKINLIKDDISDNKFLSLAIDGKAKYIISGDKHLLSLKNIYNIKIISAREFLNIIY